MSMFINSSKQAWVAAALFFTLCFIAEILWLEKRELPTYTAGAAQLGGGKWDVGLRVRLGSLSSIMSWSASFPE